MRSAALPVTEGTTADTRRYDVTVRLIASTEIPRSTEMAEIAGKKMKLLSVENQPAKAARKTIHRF